MKIRSAEFLVSAVHPNDYPARRLPEVAFVGRSNVGKSSLINGLLNRKGLVKVSSTPGRTQTLNFFRINQSFDFVDLPGYGYAQVPERVRRRFGPMVEGYLRDNPHLRCVVQIVDARHVPAEADRTMRDYLRHYGVAVLTVATKSDKLPLGRRRGRLTEIREAMGLGSQEEVIYFSAVSSEGRAAVWSALRKALASTSEA